MASAILLSSLSLRHQCWSNIRPSTNIHRVVWLSIIISSTICVYTGFTGAAASKSCPICSFISERHPTSVAPTFNQLFSIGKLLRYFHYYYTHFVFHAYTYADYSIPVLMVILWYNLLRMNICSKPCAIFCFSGLPWIIVLCQEIIDGVDNIGRG